MNDTGAALDTATREEGTAFAPRFDACGLITCVTVEARTGDVLMVAHMNLQALRATLETGYATYWSRSRNVLWKKGETSGQLQRLVEIRTDCDQDALLLRVEVAGDGGCCHTGRRSCFYRALDMSSGDPRLVKDRLTGLEQSGASDADADGQTAGRSR